MNKSINYVNPTLLMPELVNYEFRQSCGSMHYRGRNHGQRLGNRRSVGVYLPVRVKENVVVLPHGKTIYAMERTGWRRLN